MSVRRAAQPTLVVAAVVVAALTCSAAAAAPSATLVIRPGVGIAKVRLGMTEAEVRRAMGRPRLVYKRPAAFGLRAVELEYGLGAYTVRLFGRPGRLRTVRVTTSLFRERTPAGVGVGTLERSLLRAHRTVRCEPLETERHGSIRLVITIQRDCTLFAPSGRRTIFATDVQERMFEVITPAMWAQRARVVQVSVAAPA